MALGLGTLRLSPASFWSMTPRELAATLDAFAGRRAATPLARADLAALLVRFPDSCPAAARASAPLGA